MKRKLPKDTEYFHYYNANPKNKHTGDCVIRAISLALDKRYRDVLMEMAELSFKTGYSIGSSQLEQKYLKANGWKKMKQPRTPEGKKIRGKFWLNSVGNENQVVSIGSQHLTCIKDGKFWDIWDCSNDCVGVYYVKD